MSCRKKIWLLDKTFNSCQYTTSCTCKKLIINDNNNNNNK